MNPSLKLAFRHNTNIIENEMVKEISGMESWLLLFVGVCVHAQSTAGLFIAIVWTARNGLEAAAAGGSGASKFLVT